ncbi:MAG TPA: LysR family transcriptional regulator [Steroidobacteraceae bacterium]|jgi:molybdate transport system regulatory protein
MPLSHVRFRVHFNRDTTLGPGKIDLLEQIGLTGSLSEAARAMDMSYRRGWVLLHSLNTSYEQPAALTAKGGRGGGGATLTPFGRELIRIYRRFDAQLQKRAAQAFGPIARRVVSRPPRRRAARAAH